MTSITGSTPPLHRKFDEADSLRQIRNRYLALREEISDQVSALQADEAFIVLCEQYYSRGLKDWHILSAIFNLMLNNWLSENGNSLRTREDIERSKPIPGQLNGKVYEPALFTTSQMEIMFTMHATACLGRYGFEERRAVLSSESIMTFLRLRMRHFDLDVPHPPMFGRPSNDWPTFSQD